MSRTRYRAKHRDEIGVAGAARGDGLMLAIGVGVFLVGLAAAGAGLWSSARDRDTRAELKADLAAVQETSAENDLTNRAGRSALAEYADSARAFHAVADELRALLERRLLLEGDRGAVLVDGTSGDYNERVDALDALEEDVAQRATTLQALKAQLDEAFATLTNVDADPDTESGVTGGN